MVARGFTSALNSSLTNTRQHKRNVAETHTTPNDTMSMVISNMHSRKNAMTHRTTAGCGGNSEVCQQKPQSHRRTWKNMLALDTQQICNVLILVVMLTAAIQPAESTSTPKYSQLLATNGQFNEMTNNDDGDDTFRPFIPKDPAVISRSVFTPTGQFRVFQPVESDLRATVALARNAQGHQTSAPKTSINNNEKDKPHVPAKKHEKTESQKSPQEAEILGSRDPDTDDKQNTIPQNDNLSTDLRSLEDLLVEYVQNFFEKGQYQAMPGLIVELQKNYSDPSGNSLKQQSRHVRRTAPTGATVSLDMPRTLATGRLLFLTGLKKVLWPVFMGLQVLKSLLIAMFIPAIIGSFTKLLGKGLSQGSAPLFIRPMDTPQELDFRDNFNEADKFLTADEGFKDHFLTADEGLKDHGPYAYNQPEASQYSNQYAYNHVAPVSHMNPLSFTRLGMNERQHQLMQDSYMGALQSITSASFKNSNSISGGSSSQAAPPMVNKPAPAANMNNFQQFQKVPASSLLLSNYDPFYSPLLSRLDSVFGQLKLNSDNEECREKVICLMYANPAKYAPYSNLVSAQLSRELNELRKPTSDNPDILRFFKYMRAAKDGQDGVDCEKAFDKCTEFKDFENPAMVSTYHDINKLVQARKMT